MLNTTNISANREFLYLTKFRNWEKRDVLTANSFTHYRRNSPLRFPKFTLSRCTTNNHNSLIPETCTFSKVPTIPCGPQSRSYNGLKGPNAARGQQNQYSCFPFYIFWKLHMYVWAETLNRNAKKLKHFPVGTFATSCTYRVCIHTLCIYIY